MKLQSQLHLFSGANFAKSKVVDIGRLCPDEILDIKFQIDNAKTFIDDEDDDITKRNGGSLERN
jgi:hypothetical protein